MLVAVDFQAGEAEGEEELVTCALAHAADGEGFSAAGAKGGDDGGVAGIEAGGDAGKGSSCDLGKPVPGFFHEGALVLLAEGFDAAFQEGDGELEADKPLAVREDATGGKLGLLGVGGGIVGGVFQ